MGHRFSSRGSSSASLGLSCSTSSMLRLQRWSRAESCSSSGALSGSARRMLATAASWDTSGGVASTCRPGTRPSVALQAQHLLMVASCYTPGWTASTRQQVAPHEERHLSAVQHLQGSPQRLPGHKQAFGCAGAASGVTLQHLGWRLTSAGLRQLLGKRRRVQQGGHRRWHRLTTACWPEKGAARLVKHPEYIAGGSRQRGDVAPRSFTKSAWRTQSELRAGAQLTMTLSCPPPRSSLEKAAAQVEALELPATSVASRICMCASYMVSSGNAGFEQRNTC